MKLKSAGIITATGLMLMGASAHANPLFDIYAGATAGFGGYTLFADDDHLSDSAQSYGAIVGVDIPVFRFELEYDYLHYSDAKAHIGMINAYAKMPLPVVKPYLGAGIGTVFDGDADGIEFDTGMAYQGMLGLTLDLPVLPFKVDVEGRVLYAPDIFKVSDIEPDILHYDGRIKLRYVF